MTAPKYDGIMTPWVGVSDLDKAIRWYEENLGFEVEFRADEIGWCELKTATPNVYVGLYVMTPPPGSGGATLTFNVEDLDLERRRLEENGVRFEGPTVRVDGLIARASFTDPDGNPLMFCQVLHPPRN
nr:hypothetical protein [Actinoallomurus sp.]